MCFNLWAKKNDNKVLQPMNLQNFITASLVQIHDGIKYAQDKLNKRELTTEEKHFKPYIVPTPVNGEKNYYNIDFDVAVTTTKNFNIQGKTEVSVIVARLNAQGATSYSQDNSAVSRIKFTIPVIYPSMPKSI